MIKYLFCIILMACSLFVAAQTPKIPKKKVIVNLRDTTFYPIKGNFRISESGFGIYKTLEFWVYDGKGREIYYVSQGIPTGEAFADIVNQMIDHEYMAFMMKHGNILNSKKVSIIL